MVRNGWALAYREYSRAYVPEERAAHRAERGIWRGEFVKPWNWRDTKRLAGC
jgi:endonuclease YncB( thermonuclease family)